MSMLVETSEMGERRFSEADEAAALRLADRVWPRPRQAPTCTVIVPSPERAWFVVLTKMRAEADVRGELADLGYDTFVPILRKEVWNKQKRINTVREFPLFNRYLFAELPSRPEMWAPVRAIEGLERVLGCNGGRSIAASDVHRFISAQESGAFDEAKKAEDARNQSLRLQQSRGRRADAVRRFPRGSRVLALRGPFGGFSGEVTGVTGRGAVTAMMALFGGLTPVEFFPDDVAPIDAP